MVLYAMFQQRKTMPCGQVSAKFGLGGVTLCEVLPLPFPVTPGPLGELEQPTSEVGQLMGWLFWSPQLISWHVLCGPWWHCALS
jgi:hypothetical protein